MDGPSPQHERMSPRYFSMLVFGGFAVGFVVGPFLFLQLMLAWLGGLAVFLTVLYVHFVFPFPFDLLFGDAKSDAPESLISNLLALAALIAGLVLGTASAIFVVAPEVF